MTFTYAGAIKHVSLHAHKLKTKGLPAYIDALKQITPSGYAEDGLCALLLNRAIIHLHYSEDVYHLVRSLCSFIRAKGSEYGYYDVPGLWRYLPYASISDIRNKKLQAIITLLECYDKQ